MAEPDPSRIFSRGLLDGKVAVVAGDSDLAGALGGLGLTAVEPGDVDLRDAEAVDAFADEVAAEHERVDLLVVRVAGQGHGGRGELSADGFHDYLDERVQGAWHLCHALAAKAFIPQEAGKIVSIAEPASDADGSAPANAVSAAVENMTRTLSIEWARFGITTVAISVPAGEAAHEVAAVAAFLGSRAGDFHSGSVISLS